MTHRKIKTLLVANRSEIAIRVMRAASEMGIRTIGIYANEDRFGLHRFKADESYLVGAGKRPVQAYLDIPGILDIARRANVDAIHPGYGLLAENPRFAEACIEAGILFIGPTPQVMRTFGNKVAARIAAIAARVPVVAATGLLSTVAAEVAAEARAVGYPLMLKASWGGGGRGMRVVENEQELVSVIDVARHEAYSSFGNDEMYLEKLVRRARHVEVQILGDQHGNIVHLFERDCSVQRRNQKVVERAPAPYLRPSTRTAICDAALALTRSVNYSHAGTVEFLMDADSEDFYFIEVNPRIQVEHTVTEEVTGIDIVKAQIRITEGARIGEPASGVPAQADIQLSGHALQCRVTTEDPENDFAPDYGKITGYRSAAGFGLRLDGGTAYSGAVITPYYDSLLVKVTAWAPSSEEAIQRMSRALREFRIRGVSTNLAFLENVINHEEFKAGRSTTKFIDTHPELFHFAERKDRASRLLSFLGDVIVNGSAELKDRKAPALPFAIPALPDRTLTDGVPEGSRDRLLRLGAAGFARWMKDEPRVLLTDTTMRDAHQSLFATRMRTFDMVSAARHYATLVPGLFSLECWGGATFDVAMRFLKEDPWQRLHRLRQAVPNILLQMLLRGSNAVGYTNYPDNAVRYFVRRAALGGIDVFRVFDSLNWVENMRVSMDAICESGAICEAAVCYTGDLHDQRRAKYNVQYYVKLARQLERAGAHILAIKDMAGICRPRAARELVRVLKQEVGLPIHFHTHDTSGQSAASVLAAIEAGVDAVDGAMDAMSGLTSQPSLGSLTMALQGTPQSPDVSPDALQILSDYWEGVRKLYAPFDVDMRSGTADVYRHEMPGGQYTNLREQARSMGLAQRWPEISRAYAGVNLLFGDIVKVTPTSKVVGDMALFLVANDLTAADVVRGASELSFPESVVQLMRGELGYPPDGLPHDVQRAILKGVAPIVGRAADYLPDTDLTATKASLEAACERQVSDDELASYLMYPRVFTDFANHQKLYGDVSVLPTHVFFYGLREGEEVNVDLDTGKSLILRLVAKTQPDDQGQVKLFVELNGQTRIVKVAVAGAKATGRAHPQAVPGNTGHVAAPMAGVVATVSVQPGQVVSKGSALMSIEAMKMETVIRAERAGSVLRVLVLPGEQVEAKDLVIEMQPLQ